MSEPDQKWNEKLEGATPERLAVEALLAISGPEIFKPFAEVFKDEKGVENGDGPGFFSRDIRTNVRTDLNVDRRAALQAVESDDVDYLTMARLQPSVTQLWNEILFLFEHLGQELHWQLERASEEFGHDSKRLETAKGYVLLVAKYESIDDPRSIDWEGLDSGVYTLWTSRASDISLSTQYLYKSSKTVSSIINSIICLADSTAEAAFHLGNIYLSLVSALEMHGRIVQRAKFEISQINRDAQRFEKLAARAVALAQKSANNDESDDSRESCSSLYISGLASNGLVAVEEIAGFDERSGLIDPICEPVYINPATGLPMSGPGTGGFDVGGNAYGTGHLGGFDVMGSTGNFSGFDNGS